MKHTPCRQSHNNTTCKDNNKTLRTKAGRIPTHDSPRIQITQTNLNYQRGESFVTARHSKPFAQREDNTTTTVRNTKNHNTSPRVACLEGPQALTGLLQPKQINRKITYSYKTRHVIEHTLPAYIPRPADHTLDTDAPQMEQKDPEGRMSRTTSHQLRKHMLCGNPLGTTPASFIQPPHAATDPKGGEKIEERQR